jgi:hypothetical protein
LASGLFEEAKGHNRNQMFIIARLMEDESTIAPVFIDYFYLSIVYN